MQYALGFQSFLKHMKIAPVNLLTYVHGRTGLDWECLVLRFLGSEWKKTTSVKNKTGRFNPFGFDGFNQIPQNENDRTQTKILFGWLKL